jgi:hypothetical protein
VIKRVIFICCPRCWVDVTVILIGEAQRGSVVATKVNAMQQFVAAWDATASTRAYALHETGYMMSY